MDVRNEERAADPRPAEEEPRSRSQLGFPADILTSAPQQEPHTGRGPSPCLSRFPILPVHTELQPRIAKAETAVPAGSWKPFQRAGPWKNSSDLRVGRQKQRTGVPSHEDHAID